MTLYDLCKKASDTVHGFLRLQSDDPLYISTTLKVKETYGVLHEALEKFTLDEILISYNGGKDCLVMLVILLSVIYDDHEELLNSKPDLKLNTVFINSDESFSEMDEFLKESIGEYQLSCVRLNDELRVGFERYLKMKPNIKSIIVGMRRIDPYGKDLVFFERTNHNWPDFIRIHPVLNWEYREIWEFLKKLNIKYCKLYDHGYTSIGGIHNTVPNPYLLKENSQDEYHPAWQLQENDKERLSRLK